MDVCVYVDIEWIYIRTVYTVYINILHSLHTFIHSHFVFLWVETGVVVVCLIRRKAVKATLVLLPLLGITYMLFFVNPGEDEISQIVFIYFNSFLESFQVSESVEGRVCAELGEDDGTNVHGVFSCSPG